MADDNRPQRPTDEFGKRYRSSSQYAFYMRTEDGSIFDPVQTLIGDFDEKWVVLDVNPQAVTVREPFATSIQFTQGGGKIRESRGTLVKNVSISGTTGFAPLPQNQIGGLHNVTPKIVVGAAPTRGSLVSRDPSLDLLLAQRSGFLAFHRLRHLFALYGWELKRGNTSVTLNYIDTKNDYYWRIEPTEFVMQRSSRKPFSYDYTISFVMLEPSSWGKAAKDALPDVYSISDPGVRQSLRRLSEMNGSALDMLKHLSGQIERSFQGVTNQINAVTGFFENINDALTVLPEAGTHILSMFDNSLSGFVTTLGRLVDNNIVNVVSDGLRTEEQIINDLNEWYCEAQRLSDHLRYAYNSVRSKFNGDVVKTNTAFARGSAKQGTRQSFLKPVAGAQGTPDRNPFMPRSGLSLVTDVSRLASTTAVDSRVINRGDTIFSLAQRLLGDVQRFVDLVILNGLQAPYIVASAADKPSGTLAWGEIILCPASRTGIDAKPPSPSQLPPAVSSSVTDTGTLYELIDTSEIDEGFPGWSTDQFVGYTITKTHNGVDETRVVVGNTDRALQVNLPWDTAPVVGDAYALKLTLFTLHRPVTADQLTFGTDILLSFKPSNGEASTTLCDVVIGSGRDLARVSGLENYMQALNIRIRTEQGTQPVHPTFGVLMPIGRPWSNDLAFFYSAATRGSLLQDRRTAKVQNAQWSLVGTAYSFSADVQPVSVRNSRPISVTLP